MYILTILMWAIFIGLIILVGYMALKVGKCPRCSSEMSRHLKVCPFCNFCRVENDKSRIH